MAKVHGKNTVITVDGDDLSQYTNNSAFERTADSHDVTGYGADSKSYNAGLLDGKFTMGGTYDNTADSGPAAVLRPLIGGDAVTVVRRPDGTGSGKAQDSFSAILIKYSESNPVADMVTWEAEWQISGDVDDTAQS